MQEFATTALPALAQVMLQLLAEAPSEHLAVLQRVGVKVFLSCVYMTIPECLAKSQDLARQWLQVPCSPHNHTQHTRNRCVSLLFFHSMQALSSSCSQHQH